MLKLFNALLLTAACLAQTRTFRLDSADGLKQHKVTAAPATHQGRPAVRVTETAGQGEDRLLIVSGTDFQDGVIEIDLAGRPATGAAELARGFVGVAFHVAPDLSKFECFYVRPTNGRADDQVRRNHSLQYISFPEFPWQRLRKEFPEKYESYVDLVPGEWTKVKIEIRGDKGRLYVHGAPQPSLIVNDLKLANTKGAIALWIGPGTEAYFSNLRVTP
jgi:hypothetical protein